VTPEGNRSIIHLLASLRAAVAPDRLKNEPCSITVQSFSINRMDWAHSCKLILHTASIAYASIGGIRGMEFSVMMPVL